MFIRLTGSSVVWLWGWLAWWVLPIGEASEFCLFATTGAIVKTRVVAAAVAVAARQGKVSEAVAAAAVLIVVE